MGYAVGIANAPYWRYSRLLQEVGDISYVAIHARNRVSLRNPVSLYYDLRSDATHGGDGALRCANTPYG